MSEKRKISRRRFLKIVGTGAMGLGVTSYLQWNSAYRPRLEKHTLFLPRWDAPGFKLALLSDFHIFSDLAASRTRQALEIALAQKPDALLLAGDFVDGRWKEDSNLLELAFAPLRDVRVPALGIMGNHDYCTMSPAKSLTALRQAPFRLLRNESVDLGGVMVVGYDDALCGEIRFDFLSEKRMATSTLALLHEPDFVSKLPKKVSLCLSGHSHGGQICLPFGASLYTPYGARRYVAGYYSEAHRPLYVSRGVGTTGYDFRLFCPPEVTILTLQKGLES